jgi:hypothetical protein
VFEIHPILFIGVLLTGHVLRRKCLIKHVTEGNIEVRIKVKEDEEKGVSSYWMS